MNVVGQLNNKQVPTTYVPSAFGLPTYRPQLKFSSRSGVGKFYFINSFNFVGGTVLQ